MICVDCHRLTAMYRRERCNLCEAKLLRSRPSTPIEPPPYRPEDHVGKRERLRRMIEAAREKTPW